MFLIVAVADLTVFGTTLVLELNGVFHHDKIEGKAAKEAQAAKSAEKKAKQAERDAKRALLTKSAIVKSNTAVNEADDELRRQATI